MGKGDTYANDLLRLLYNATAIANVADNAATSPLTNIFVALHSADPGAAGAQNNNEISYTGYARVSVARTTGGWTVTGRSVSPVANIDFGAATAGSATAMFFSTGAAVSGATKIFHRGVIGSAQGPLTAVAADTITIPGHTFAVDDRIVFFAVDGSALPTGITEGTVYFVKTVSSNDITISTTQGGATLDITAAGDGRVWKVTPLVITSTPSTTPRLTTASTIID